MKKLTLPLVLLSFTVGACAEPPVVDDDVSATVVEVARIDSDDGTLQMFAAPNGTIAIAEKTTRRRTAAEALVAEHDATALEVYLALAPAGAVAADELWADHREARGDLAPRALALPLASAHDQFPFDDCNSGDWATFLAGVQASYDARYRRWVSTSGNITTSSIAEDTGRRRFDMCAGDDFIYSGPATVTIRSKTDGGAVYGFVTDEQVGYHERFYYSSSYGHPDWQMQVTEPANGTTRSVGLGRAESPPLGIEL